jgi:hypothetical protein
MKEKKLAGKYKGITKSLVVAAFPSIIEAGTSTQVEEQE